MSHSPFDNIKIALDTNILSYLLDDTYPNLNTFIESLRDNSLVDLVCSQFVIYELIEIRKLEHYIRKVHEETTGKGGQMNFSSVLKYRKNWSAPELDYSNVCDEIKEIVKEEIKQIWNNYDIRFSEKSIHQELWNPHQELVLTSKISKEDSLVLLSSVYPEVSQEEEYLIFLTNDDQFYRGYNEIDRLESIFNLDNIKKPFVLKLSDITLPDSKTKLDLIKGSETPEQIKEFINKFIFEHFKEKYINYYLGDIIPCQCKDKRDILCFKLNADSLNKGIYLSVLTKGLKVINIPELQSNFWAHGEIESYPHTPKLDSKEREISIKLVNNEKKSLLKKEVLEEIMINGNIVFIHPDSK